MLQSINVRIAYDGNCPFCDAYVKMLRLTEHYKVELIDARGDHSLICEIVNRGYDLDEGMVVEIEGQYFFGDEAMTRMALMTANSGLLRRLTKWVFKNNWRSKNLYPILRAGRNLTLKALGHKKINN